MTDIAQPVGSWTDQQTIAAGESALKRFRDLGVSIPKGDRLSRALITLRRERPVTGKVAGTYDVSRELTEATRTAVEMHFIAIHAVARPEVLDLIRISLDGADIPEADSPDNSKPRDTQVELLVWAIFRAAGHPAAIEEPDVVVATPIGRYGIAVKRSSGRDARRLVEKGVKQIARHTGVGFVAVAADRRMTEAERADPYTAFSQAIAADLMAQRDKQAQGRHSAAILAVFLVGTSYRWIDGGSGPLCIVSAHFRVSPNPSRSVDDDVLEPFFQQVAQSFAASLASPP